MAAAPAARPTFTAVVHQALLGTGATSGWLLAVEADRLRVLAAAGPQNQVAAVGTLLTPSATHRYVLASGQATALMPQPGDPASAGAGGHLGVPPSILVVPCCGPENLGLLELAAKRGAPSFTFDDLTLAGALAAVAGAALGERVDVPAPTVAPAQLSAALERLAAADPRRYLRTAQVIEALLDGGS